jgi:hypothetical protein
MLIKFNGLSDFFFSFFKMISSSKIASLIDEPTAVRDLPSSKFNYENFFSDICSLDSFLTE